MRKVVLSMMVSLDGYIESSNPEEYWHNWNEEMSAYMMDFFKTVDTFIYGRKSYEDMIAYWPPLTDEFATVMNQTQKLVFSRTLDKVNWNSTLITKDPVDEIQRMKQQDGKNLVLFAGADLAETFIKNNLIDEYRLIVNPIVLGGGKPLFKNINQPFSLKLNDTIIFNCGNVILIYEPITHNQQ
jgi:dihydrofolate reductase